MRRPDKQQGLTAISMLLLLGLIALIAIVVIKTLPLYLNQMKVARLVNGIAEDPELSMADPTLIRDRMQRRWDIEDITIIQPRDIKIRRLATGRVLSYDYEARAHLFYNISIVLQFAEDKPLRGESAGVDG